MFIRKLWFWEMSGGASTSDGVGLGNKNSFPSPIVIYQSTDEHGSTDAYIGIWGKSKEDTEKYASKVARLAGTSLGETYLGEIPNGKWCAVSASGWEEEEEEGEWGVSDPPDKNCATLSVFSPTSKTNEWNAKTWGVSSGTSKDAYNTGVAASGSVLGANYTRIGGATRISLMATCGIALGIGIAGIIIALLAFAADSGGVVALALLMAVGGFICSIFGWWMSPVRQRLFSFFSIHSPPASLIKSIKRGVPRKGVFNSRFGFAYTATEKAIVSWANSSALNLNQNIGGVALATDEQGRAVRIPDDDRAGNIIMVGAPGSGKTTLMLNLYAGDLVWREKASNGAARATRGLVWVETKKDGAKRLEALASKAGVDLLKISVASKSGARLRLSFSKSASQDASMLTGAMVQAFGDTAIQERSREALHAIFTIAYFVWPDHLTQIDDNVRPNLMRTAWILMGGLNWEKAEELYGAVSVISDPELEAACETYETYLRKTNTNREEQLAAPRNKVSKLKDLPVFDMDCRREAWSWKEILENHKAVILDLSGAGDESGDPSLGEEIVRIITPLALYTIWQTAQFICEGWQDEGKSFAFYCDEVSNLSAHAGNLLESIADQGRSRGFEVVLGAQRWSQLDLSVKNALLQFFNQVFLKLNDTSSATEASATFLGRVPPEEFMQLPSYVGYAIISIEGKRVAPIKLKVVNDKAWEPANAWQLNATINEG